MISSLKLENVKNNIYFVANIMILSNVVNYSLLGTSLFDNKWLYSSFGILIAYIFYSFISDNLISFNDDDYIYKKSKNDAIRYIVIYTLAHFLVSFLDKGFVLLENETKEVRSVAENFCSYFRNTLFILKKI